MTSMFWGLRLEPGKRYTTTVDKSFHVSMAALDVGTVQSENDVIPVYLEEGYGGTPFILCNLQKKKQLQSNLDLNFLTGDRITFFSKGPGVVHLSGYIVPDEYNFDTDEEADEEEDDEDDSLTITGENGLKRKLKTSSRSAGMTKKKGKMIEEYPTEDSEDDDDAEEEDDDDDDEDSDQLLSSLNAEDDSDESEDDENEEASEEEETPTPKGKKNKNQQTTPKQAQNQKKQNGLTPKQGKKEGKKSENLNTSQKLNKSTEESSPQKKTLEGGVLIKDIKVGSGPVCSKGKQAVVYYTGRLKSNNKVFDTTTNGPGFKFKVGKGDVIKAWDVGVVGMKVGGKRLITCPPNMAYGQKGAPPSIPGNSTLMFEVELKAVN